MKKRNKKYNPQKLQTMRNQGKVSRSVPLTALTPQQVALKIRAKQIIKQNSFPAIRDQREGCEHPNAYWQLTHDDCRLTEIQKRKILKTVGMDYDRQPKPSKAELEMELSA